METLLISQVVLLILILLLAGLLLLTIRQVGVLFERVAPLGALTLPQSAKVGEPVAELQSATIKGEPVTIGGVRAQGNAQLLLFISPNCPVCKQVLAYLRSFARSESAPIDIMLVGDGALNDYESLVKEHRLEGFRLLLDPRVGMTYRIGKLPYAMLIKPSGILQSSGLVNSREHLESIVVAFEHDVASLQEYMRDRRIASTEESPTQHGVPQSPRFAQNKGS